MSDKSTTEFSSWADRVRSARAAKEAAAGAYEQTLRDARHIGGMSVNAIAAAMGIKDRVQITRYLGREHARDTPSVRLPVAVSLHGAGRSDRDWAELRAGVAARGWYSATDQDAWHLSRAGARTVLVYWSTPQVRIELVRAVHSQPVETPVVSRLADHLPTAAAVWLMREHPDIAEHPVAEYDDHSVQWRVLAQRTHALPERWDDDATNTMGRRGAVVPDVAPVAGWIAAILDQT